MTHSQKTIRCLLCAFVSVSLGVFAAILIHDARSLVQADQTTATVTILAPLPTTASGDIDYYMLALSPVAVFPRNAKAGAESVYEVTFTSGMSISSGGTLRLTFPLGFGFASTCATPLQTPENSDLNGSAVGTVRIASISCENTASRIIVTIGGASLQSGDTVHFFLQGIINARVSSYDAQGSGSSLSIETRDVSQRFLELKTSLPFFLAPSGSQKISGALFVDNGAGLFGFARDNRRGGSEPGLSGVQVCLYGVGGTQCRDTTTDGSYEFAGLTDGYYSISIPPLSSGSVVGGPFFADFYLDDGASEAGVDFPFLPAEQTITVEITNIPSGANLDVFAYSAMQGGHVVRQVSWNGEATRLISLPVSDGSWNVGVGPALSQNGSTLASSALFISPHTQDIEVSGDGTYWISFSLRAAVKKIYGRVVDGAGTGIANAFLVARPSTLAGDAGMESVGQSAGDGSFELNVADGAYVLEASVPGMPPVNGIDITVVADSGNSTADSNETADVYSGGVLITNDGDEGSDNLLIVFAKGEHSISGRVLDADSNAIPFAYVSAEEVDGEGVPLGAYVGSPTDETGSYTLFAFDGIWNIRAFTPDIGEIQGKTVALNGQNLTGQNVRVSAAYFGTVKGTVTKGGSPVAGAFVGVYGSAGGNTTTTDANGRYTVRVKAGDDYTIDAYIAGMGHLAPLEGVNVAGGATVENKNFVVSLPGTITVTIAGVSDAYVDAVDANGIGESTSSNPTPGVYVLSLGPGTYTVTARTARDGLLGEQGNVVISSGGTRAVSFSPPSPHTVSGTIVSGSSACVGGVSVFIVDAESGRTGSAVTNSAGTYSFIVSNGDYLLSATKQGCIDGEEPILFSVQGDDVSLANRRMTQPSATVSGSVLLSGRNVTTETKVIAESSAGSVVSTPVNIAAVSGANYSLTLTPGTWRIFARADGYESSKHTVDVSTGGRTLTMTVAAISGYVVTEKATTPLQPSRGGIVKNADAGDRFAITIPAGALGTSSNSGSVSTKVTTAVVTQTPTAKVLGGKGVEITPKDAAGKPITTLATTGGGLKITLPYAKSDVVALGGDETKLMLAVWSDEKQQWTPLATTVDTINSALSAVPPHFSVFAPIIPTKGMSAPPVSPQVSPASSPAPSGGISGASPISGTVLPPQQQRAVTPPVSQETEMTPEQPTIVPVATVVEEEFSPVVPPREERASSPSPSSSPKKKSRFPSVARSRATFVPRTKHTQSPGTAPSFFEVSISVDDTGRRLVPGSDLVIHGEMFKSSSARENVPVRYSIHSPDGRTISESSEVLSVGERAVFSKTFHIDDAIADGHYTVTVEVSRNGDIISSSDSFQVRQRIVRPAELIAPSPSPAGERSLPSTALGFLVVLLVGGLIQLWYTLKRFTL